MCGYLLVSLILAIWRASFVVPSDMNLTVLFNTPLNKITPMGSTMLVSVRVPFTAQSFLSCLKPPTVSTHPKGHVELSRCLLHWCDAY